MKARRFILQCASVMLVLVFSQKVGAGFFLHNLLHSQDASAPFEAARQDSSSNEINFACSCIDDFLMPFTATEEISFPSPLAEYSKPTADFIDGISFRPVISSNLRGPPSLVL